ncbi:MAG TPA: hypothetical protein VIO61_07705 [Anaerolineaceae bacterium]
MFQKTATIPGSISTALDRLESLIGRIGSLNPEQARQILIDMDAVQQRLDEASADENALRAERSQFNHFEATLKREARAFLNDIGGTSALTSLREQVAPPPEAWWWNIDEWLVTQRRRSLSRLLIGIGFGAVALIILAVIYKFFLEPSPADQARYAHQINAQNLLEKKDYRAALSEAEKGLEIVPNDTEFLMLKGVLHQILGETVQAEETYRKVEPLLGSRLQFLVLRSQTFLGAGEAKLALEDAQAAIALDPNSAMANLVAGSASEALGEKQQAARYFEEASRLANEQGLDELNALARVRLAYLLQGMSTIPTPRQ